MLAMVRMHLLGYPFGLFTASKNQDSSFPDLFLVDQDDGNAVEKNEATAWQKVKHLIDLHPGKYDCRKAFNNTSNEPPKCQSVSPLFSGIKLGYEKPRKMFSDPTYLELLTSQTQRDIDCLKGMMCSPALGSLLFTLKEYDFREDEKDKPNNDPEYDKLLNECTGKRVVVSGSYVGGTGPSVAPTLAYRLQKDKSQVMAVMVGRWFEFIESGKYQDEARNRNKSMKENEAAGFAFTAFTSDKLSKPSQVATVLVGVESPENTKREYTGDNQQKLENSHTHVIAALAGIQHFLSESEGGKEPGLYGVSGSDNSQLTKDIAIKGWEEQQPVRLEDLVLQASFLVFYLNKIIEALRKTKTQKDGLVRTMHRLINFVNYGTPNSPISSTVKWIDEQVGSNWAKFNIVADRLENIKDIYDEQLRWLCNLSQELETLRRELDVDKKDFESDFTYRTNKDPFPPLGGNPTSENIALGLFHWVGRWVNEDMWPNRRNLAPPSETPIGYWPLAKQAGLRPPFSHPGTLKSLDPSKISTCMKDFYLLDDISVNGWPHPTAVVEEYRFKIISEHPIARRKLELLLVGLACELLILEQIKPTGEVSAVSLENLLKEEYPLMAQYRIVNRDGSKIYGFNSPETLLCPVQDVEDTDWKDLWCQLTGGEEENFDWQQKSDFWGDVSKMRYRGAFKCVAGWLKHLKKNGICPVWVELLSTGELGQFTGYFGIAEWLPVSFKQKKNGKDSPIEAIPLPIAGESLPLPEGEVSGKVMSKDDLVKEIRSFEKFEGEYYLVEDFMMPGHERSVNLIWKEHIDKIQKKEEIFAWGLDKEKTRFWYKESLKSKAVYIKNLRVIDEREIGIKVCIPLEQSLVPGSTSEIEDGTLKYPDLPLLPEYSDLAVDVNGKEWIRNNWDGFIIKPEPENSFVMWRLRLKGCSEEKTIRVSCGTSNLKPARAHWMIWPNFKSVNSEEKPWMAYYFYEHSTRKSLKANVVFRDKKGALSEPYGRSDDQKGLTRAVKYDVVSGHHDGGPPVALCAYDEKFKLDVGIYAIRYEKRLEREGTWELAVDFGTSHTVAAGRTGGKKKREKIKLTPELSYRRSNRFRRSDISLHISENWRGTPKNPPPSEMQLELWRPTYVDEDAKSISELPSDLWSFKELRSLEIDKIQEKWEPMTHYAIPVRQLYQLENAHSHMISGFKWEMDDQMFESRKSWIQQKYLELAIEIFLAQRVYQEGGLPERIQFTFTYPIRGIRTQETENYQSSTRELLRSMSESLGNEFLDPYYYSESHAAQDTVGPGGDLEVKLVADLGGGTLDIFISADSNKGVKFEKAADSILLGGHYLLRIMEKYPSKYLPKSWEYGLEQADVLTRKLNDWSTFEKLKAWMRLEGAHKLFGGDYLNGYKSDRLELQGFEKLSHGDDARSLINRYFGLLTDFLARNIVAYVVKDVLPKVKDEYPDHLEEMKLFVKIQGNGWRLWYDKSEYEDIQKEVEQWVRIRAKQLWEQYNVEYLDFCVKKGDGLWEKSETSPDPKHEQIKKALGKNISPEEVQKQTHKFSLINVFLRYASSTKEDEPRTWYDSLPFEIRKNDVKPIPVVRKFDPPLCVDIADEGVPVTFNQILSIEQNLMKAIRDGLTKKEHGGTTLVAGKLHVPLELVWENVLKSEKIEQGN